MAGVRCFDSFKANLTASEWSSARKKKTMYNEMQKNVVLYGTANPTKSNGKKYNKNIKVNGTCDLTGSGGYIEYAQSYVIMNDITEGGPLCNDPTSVEDDNRSRAVLMETCSTTCSNTFDAGFQDIGRSGEASFFDLVATPTVVPAGELTGETQMGTGEFRYRNATFIGEFDITVDTNPIVVFQFSQDGINWFSDGNQASLFDPDPPSMIRQFCLQRSNVPTLWVGLYYVTQATANKIQLVLTKS